MEHSSIFDIWRQCGRLSHDNDVTGHGYHRMIRNGHASKLFLETAATCGSDRLALAASVRVLSAQTLDLSSKRDPHSLAVRPRGDASGSAVPGLREWASKGCEHASSDVR